MLSCTAPAITHGLGPLASFPEMVKLKASLAHLIIPILSYPLATSNQRHQVEFPPSVAWYPKSFPSCSLPLFQPHLPSSPPPLNPPAPQPQISSLWLNIIDMYQVLEWKLRISFPACSSSFLLLSFHLPPFLPGSTLPAAIAFYIVS